MSTRWKCIRNDRAVNVRLTIKDGSEHDGKVVDAKEIEDGMFLCDLGNGEPYIVTKDEFWRPPPRDVYRELRARAIPAEPMCDVCPYTRMQRDQANSSFKCQDCGMTMSSAVWHLRLAECL